MWSGNCGHPAFTETPVVLRETEGIPNFSWIPRIVSDSFGRGQAVGVPARLSSLSGTRIENDESPRIPECSRRCRRSRRRSWKVKAICPQNAAKADYTLTIAPVSVEIAPKKIVKTIGYNGAVPGPLLRLREGEPVTIDVINQTASLSELVHWHGLRILRMSTGPCEEGTPMILGKACRRYAFSRPAPSGLRVGITATFPRGRNLNRGTYTGQFGFLYI